MLKSALCAALIGLSWFSQPEAAASTVRLDPEATRVTFTLGATLHTVHGSFELREGWIRFEPGSGAVTGRMVVDAGSGETGSEKRDRKMHRTVLESSLHPDIVFEPDRIEGTVPIEGYGDLTLHGTLRIHGSRHPLSVPLRVSIAGQRVEATGSFPIPYVEWGMADPSVFVLRVKKHVEVTVRAVGQIAEASAE